MCRLSAAVRAAAVVVAFLGFARTCLGSGPVGRFVDAGPSLAAAAADSAAAAGVAGRYRIASIEVNAQLSDTVAEVQVSQTFENTGSVQMEVCFMFPLPYDGAIDQLTLLVDGKEYEAKLLSKEEARERYEEIVRKNRDPALLEWVGTGMFQTSVFPIPAGREANRHAALLAALPQDRTGSPISSSR